MTQQLFASARLFARIALTGPICLYFEFRCWKAAANLLVADIALLFIGLWPAAISLHFTIGALITWDAWQQAKNQREPLRITKQ